MAFEDVPSSRTSIVSIDPVVARHIKGINASANSKQPLHSRTESSPAKMADDPTKASSPGHGRTSSAPNRTDHKRSNSLRRAKNSTEVLRQRSKSGKKSTTVETIPDTREGRNFSIGNVGMGGLLYLRPSVNQAVAMPPASPVMIPNTAPANMPVSNHNHDPRFFSQKQSELDNIPAAHVHSNSPKWATVRHHRQPTNNAIRALHGRSRSFSTIEESRQTLSSPQTNVLRVVINRPEVETPDTSVSSDQETPKFTLPTLQVPIPHYRLGTPRFSIQGTPILRSSTYTDSSNSSTDASHFGFDDVQQGLVPASPEMMNIGKQRAPLGGYQEDIRKASGHMRHSSRSSSTTSTIRDHVVPEIYDELAVVYNDPSIVRYSQNVREITAATPARIIAQISSESFMDYELVSDFFLTFRSYMSPFTVLDLLLARLKWAINRQEDDGRIIRVRTFAALRHWILNYFLDDFMPDRKLRIRFCHEINKMYAGVRERSTVGSSDLKVLRDLKRCWNGRCMLYWNPLDFSLDGDQDEDLQPGGIEETTDGPYESGTPEPEYQSPPLTATIRSKRGPQSSWFETPPVTAPSPHHVRKISSGKQASVTSDGSIQAGSCSIPKTNRRHGDDDMHKYAGPHPVSVQSRRKNAPANLQVSTNASPPVGQRRDATSMESDRDLTPRYVVAPSPQIRSSNGSLIRGFVYAPSAPFVQIITTPTTPSMPRFDVNNLHSEYPRRTGQPNSATLPHVKNIFGSLRKALGGKHGHHDTALLTVSAPMPLQNAAQNRFNKPLSPVKSHEEFQPFRAPTSPKSQVRIDLLCAAVAQNYEAVFPPSQRPRQFDINFQNSATLPQNEFHGNTYNPTYLSPDMGRERLASHGTAQSGSILIVDDTGLGVAEMSGALRSVTSLQNTWQGEAETFGASRGLGIGDQPQSNFDHVESRKVSQGSEGERGLNEILPHDKFVQEGYQSPETNRQSRSIHSYQRTHIRNAASTGSSATLRNQKSYQSSPVVGRGNGSVDGTNITEYSQQLDHDEENSRFPPPILRRRPGGDLRNIEKVQELPQPLRHASLDTFTTTTRSNNSSFLLGSGTNKFSGPPNQQKPVSMINTHSSQHLRPSFEAAVAGFSRIPDDDDGGLEATLRKLEGNYDRASPPLEQYPVEGTDRRRSMPNLNQHTPLESAYTQTDDRISKTEYVQDSRSSRGENGGRSEPSSKKSSVFGIQRGSAAGSEASYDSIPLLKRDTATRPISQTNFIPSPLHVQKGLKASDTTNIRSSQQGRGSIPKTSSGNLPRPHTMIDGARSFLLDEDENLSDLSSEISVDIINYPEAVDPSMEPMLAAPGTALSGLEIPSHPLTYASVVNLAPPEQIYDDSPILDEAQAANTLTYQNIQGGTPAHPKNTTTRISGGPAHIPFLLACDSQILAQQLTLIEKSALSEVEWFDLVEMRWDERAPGVLDWAEYLARGDVRGIDLVITRFNLVVKWTLSEIVLTQDIQERAQVITKLIHVAAHARRLHNYATMLQLTIALTSVDCARLIKTWNMVSDPDKSLLKNMEALIQPVRNFHDLRAEMEASDMSDGCIPFIGLYVHDLTYNAQKPAEVVGARGSGPLINFERYRTAAIIVKGLLRLIDASTRYQFEPVPGIIERCLWLAALSDERIASMSKVLEK